MFQILKCPYKKEPFAINLKEYGINLENNFRTKEECEKAYNSIHFDDGLKNVLFRIKKVIKN